MSNSQAKKNQMCFRWHISRIVGKATSDQRDVHVTITSETDKLREFLSEHESMGIADIQEDRLEWWHGEKYEFEGYINEHTLLNVYIRQNIASDSKPRVYSFEERALEEDMVLLLFVPNSSQALFRKYYMPLKTQWNENEFPDVTSLAEIKEAIWLDFTLASRRMAKTLYQKVSGTWDKKSEDKNASQ